MPEISVVVPVYNGEDYIERCYASIAAQDFKDIEIIFVDDESKDNTVKILNSIKEKDSRVRIISQKNKRQGGARNTGVQAACGNYVSFIDADDFVSSDFLSGLYNSIKKFDADISMTSVIRYKSENNQKVLLKYDKMICCTEKCEKSQITVGEGTGRGIWNKLFRKEFLIKNNLKFREYVSYEDCDYCAKAVYYADKISTSDTGNYFYFVNNKSTMRASIDSKKQEDKYTGAKLTLLFELEHGIVDKPGLINKYDYSWFGFNILRIKDKMDLENTYRQWWLFDFIKIFQRKYKTKAL